MRVIPTRNANCADRPGLGGWGPYSDLVATARGPNPDPRHPTPRQDVRDESNPYEGGEERWAREAGAPHPRRPLLGGARGDRGSPPEPVGDANRPAMPLRCGTEGAGIAVGSG